jgi:hypothetical protein
MLQSKCLLIYSIASNKCHKFLGKQCKENSTPFSDEFDTKGEE